MSEYLYIHLGDKLKARRKELNLTQDALSKLTSLTRSSIANIEKGKQRVPLHLLYVLSKSLQFETIHELLPESLDILGEAGLPKKTHLKKGITQPLPESRLKALLMDD